MLEPRRGSLPVHARDLNLTFEAPVPRGRDLTLRLFGNLLRRRRWQVLACTVLTVGLVGAYVVVARPVYESIASIRIEEEAVDIPEPIRRLSEENQISTEIQVLGSRALAEEVIHRLGLQLQSSSPRKVPRSALFADVAVTGGGDSATIDLVRQPAGGFLISDHATGQTLGSVRAGDTLSLGSASMRLLPAADSAPKIRFTVESMEEAVTDFASQMLVSRPARDANVISLRYRSSDPILAAQVPNLMAERFISNRQSERTTRARSTAKFLRQQLEALSHQLTTAEESLKVFREREQIVSLPEEATDQVKNLTAMQAQRAGLETERSALASLLTEIESSRTAPVPGEPSPYRRLAAFPSLIGNQSVTELLRSLSKLEDDRAELLIRRTPEDPDVKALDTRIHAVDAQLRNLSLTYLSGLTYQVISIDSILKDFGKDLRRIPAKEVEYGRLDRGPKVLQDLYTMLQTRLKEAEISEAVEDPSVRVVDPAVIPIKPIRPKPVLYLAASVLMGLMLGTAFALWREYADRSVHTRADISEVAGIPVLGLVPRIPRIKEVVGRSRKQVGNGSAAAGNNPVMIPTGYHRTTGKNGDGDPSLDSLAMVSHGRDAAILEAYARLETNIAFTSPGVGPKILMFTSPLPGEGKTVSATNLALTLTRRGFQTLLIDADLRCGVIHRLFGLGRDPGLTNLLLDTAGLSSTLRKVPLNGGGTLHVLTGGLRPQNPSAILGSSALPKLLEELAQRFGMIIIDSPPLNVVTDALVLAPLVDGVIVVARAGVTQSGSLAYAMEQLRAARAPVIGGLLNDIDFRRDAGYDKASEYLEYSKYYSSTNA